MLEPTRLVAERMADELRELDCAPLELDTVSDPSAPTDVDPPPPLDPPLDAVPAARELTCVFELREALKERLSRPKPDREPRNWGASSCEKRSAPVEPVSRIVFFNGPATAFAVRMPAVSEPFFWSWAEACRI